MVIKGGQLDFFKAHLIEYFGVDDVKPESIAKIKFTDPGDPAYPAERPPVSFELTADTPATESARVGRSRFSAEFFDKSGKSIWKSK